MNPNVNAQQFFHGTVADIKPGSAVRPAGTPEQSNFEQLYEEKGQSWRAQHVFSTPTETQAWMWGAIASNKQLHKPEVQARPRVYRVKPTGKPSMDVPAELHGGTEHEQISKRALVKQEVWTPPPEAARHVSSNWTPVGAPTKPVGMQGTLPPQDWRSSYADPMDAPERAQFKQRPLPTGPTGVERLPPERTRMAGQRRLLPAPSRKTREERLAPILSRTAEFRKKLEWDARGVRSPGSSISMGEEHRQNIRRRRSVPKKGEL